MEISIFAYVVIVLCTMSAGTLTGYQIGKEKGIYEGYRRGIATGRAISKVER